MRVVTILLLFVPVAALAFRTVEILPAFAIAVLFAFGVTELVNLVYKTEES
jgi:hypothetical protein